MFRLNIQKWTAFQPALSNSFADQSYRKNFSLHILVIIPVKKQDGQDLEFSEGKTSRYVFVPGVRNIQETSVVFGEQFFGKQTSEVHDVVARAAKNNIVKVGFGVHGPRAGEVNKK